jgi:hypothetical protein
MCTWIAPLSPLIRLNYLSIFFFLICSQEHVILGKLSSLGAFYRRSPFLHFIQGMSSGDLWTQNINQWTDKVWGYCLYFLGVLDLKIRDEFYSMLTMMKGQILSTKLIKRFFYSNFILLLLFYPEANHALSDLLKRVFFVLSSPALCQVLNDRNIDIFWILLFLKILEA